MLVDHKNNSTKVISTGTELVGVISRVQFAFKQWVRRNGVEGEIYKWIHNEESLRGFLLDRIEKAEFATGFFGVPDKVSEIAELRLRPKGKVEKRIKEYEKKYKSVIIGYADGTEKEFSPPEWAIFEEGVRKIATSAFFIEK